MPSCAGLPQQVSCWRVNMAKLSIGIDIGGTFTDFVVHDPAADALRSFKLPTTPHDPSVAVLEGLASILKPDSTARIIHGSTVATNALLERKGVATALITTRGFRDVLQIGRQNRPQLYDLFADPPTPLVKRDWRYEVDERVDAQGNVLIALQDAQVDGLAAQLRLQGIASVAICLLFSFLHPEHEQRIANVLRRGGFFVSASHEVLPQHREYERTSTTVINAYVSPILDRYLANLETAIHSVALKSSVDLRIMQSNGGIISPAEARSNGVHCIMSGPAGGVVGALTVARAAQPPGAEVKIISFDMGGTSTDVSLCEGDIQTTSEASVGGFPIRIPIIDIHTVGAGGGSIAAVDAGGALRVGPQSAGADPGPACYGHSDTPTVTDANVVLGRLPGAYFLGGRMPLDEARAWHAIGELGARIGLSATETALGIVAIANAHMERALRVISVERGYDPRDFTLVSIGGAGGLHAAELARRVGIRSVLIPPFASTLSAYGMLAADVVKDYGITVMLPGNIDAVTLATQFQPLVDRCMHEALAEDVGPENIVIQQSLDMRYHGQSYELNIAFSPDYRTAFEAAHARAYGYHRPDVATEIVNLRVRAIGRVAKPPLQTRNASHGDSQPALLETRQVMFDRQLNVPFYRGELLQPGHALHGPAIIVRNDTTVLLNSGDNAVIDAHRNIIITVPTDGSNEATP